MRFVFSNVFISIIKLFDIQVPRTDTESNDQEEVRQLRENVVSLTAELDATNRIWEQQQQRQLDTLRNQLQNCLWIDHDTSFDDIVQQVVDQITKEREDFSERYTALEKANNDLRSGSSILMIVNLNSLLVYCLQNQVIIWNRFDNLI